MANGPIDYTSGQVAPADFLRSLSGGLQVGAQIQQQQQAAAQQQAAQAAAAAYSADAQSAMANPTPQAFAALALKYPSQREAVKQSWDGLSAAEQKSEGDTMSQAYAALLAGKPDVAKSVVQNQIAARKNTGLDTSQFDSALQLLDTDPQKAQAALGFTLSHIGDPKDFAAKFGALQGEQRAEDLAPAALKDATAKADGAEADAVQKNFGVLGSTLGALQGKNAKPTQIETALKSMAAKGIISKDDLPDYISAIPTDAAVREQWLGSMQAAGLKPEEQVKLTTPDANSKLSAQTQLATTSMNNRTQLAVQDRIDARSAKDAAGSDDTASFSADAIDNAAARYNTDGTLPPMGMGAAAAAGRTKILNRAAEMKKGVTPEQQRLDQLANKGNVASQTAAIKQFTSGKLGSSVRSFNVGLSHLDTLDNLADALGNKDTQAINRIGNYVATQTGSAAPTSFNAAKKIVGDEIVKAIVGSGGGVADREEAAKTISAANSPAQLKATIKTYKELMVGQLGGLEQQYTTSTGRKDFDQLLSPAALAIKAQHAPKKAAPSAAASPGVAAGWSVTVHP